MSTLQLSLPESMRAFVEEQVAKGGHGSADEYVRTLIREVQIRQEKEKLEAMLLEGLNSGEPIEVTEEYWAEKMRRYEERHRPDSANGS